MTPGSDSYVTLDEADEYVEAFYPGNRWFDLSDAQKQQRLVPACERLEALPFSGKKTDHAQELSFPRFPGTQVPGSIKAAQIEIALLDMRADSSEAAQRTSLQRQGVTAFSIGDLSESYGSKSALISQHDFLADVKIFGLLGRFLQGGYPIC